jgi:hypothetical protein
VVEMGMCLSEEAFSCQGLDFQSQGLFPPLDQVTNLGGGK